MSNQYLSFDVTKQSAPQQLITGRQGDSQLKFTSVLLWDGDKNIPYDLTGKQIAFEALKPDGTHIVDYAGITILDAQHGLFRYSFNEQVFAVAGTMQQAFFKITHTDKDKQVITDSTLEINIHILENRVEFGINSSDYLSEYDDLIAQVKQKFDDYADTVQSSINEAKALREEINSYIDQIRDKQVLLFKETGKTVNGNKIIEALSEDTEGKQHTVYPQTDVSAVLGLTDEIKDVAPRETSYYKEVKYSEYTDKDTSTPYILVRIPHTDGNGNVIKLKNGFAHDKYSATGKEVPRSFRKRHKNATVIINAAPWDTNTGELKGRFIQDGKILNATTSAGKETLGVDKNGKLKSYPNSKSIDDLVDDGIVNAIGGYFPLIVGGQKYDYTSLYQPIYPNMDTKRPRQVIAQMANLDIYIFTFDGKTRRSSGMTLEETVKVIQSYNVDFAFNLDGGGSNATIVNGMMMNSPIDNDKDERAVPNFLYFEKDSTHTIDTTDDNELFELSKKATTSYRKLFDDLLDSNCNFRGTLYTQLGPKDLATVASDLDKYRGSWINASDDLKNVPATTENGHYTIIEVIPYNAKNGIIKLTRWGDNTIWSIGVINGQLTTWDALTSNTKKAPFTKFTDVAQNVARYAGTWYTDENDILGAPVNSEHGHFSIIEVVPRSQTSGLIRLTRYGDNVAWQAGIDNGKLTSWESLTGDTKKATFTSLATVASKLAEYVGTWYTEETDITNTPDGSKYGHHSVIEIVQLENNSGFIRLTRYGDNLSWQAGVNQGKLTSWKQLVS